jgi:preprotein translocase subunit SecF
MMAGFSLVTVNWDFMGKRRMAMVVSLSLVLVSIISFVARGFNFGIDFTGGILVEVRYQQPVELDSVRSALEKGGFTKAVVQSFGSAHDVLIRVPPSKGGSNAQVSTALLNALRAGSAGNDVEQRRVEFVGPQVGDELASDGGLAILVALFGIFVYVMIRFEWRFALGAIVATLHDVIITVGLFSVTGLEFDLTVLAAVLAVIGYSVNDTVVVFDRIRENFRKMRKAEPEQAMNAAINQTLSRTTITSFVTLLAVLALLFFGGDLIRNFSIALVAGIIVGTFSSIYVASATALMMGVSKADLMPVKKEGADLDARP